MSDAGDNSARPFRPKKRKRKFKTPSTDDEILISYAAVSAENPVDFSYSSDEGLFNPQDTYSDWYSEDEHIVQEATFPDFAVVEEVKWENHPTSMEQFPFTKSECLIKPTTCDNPIDYFHHILTDDMLEEIIARTNDYARYELCGRQTYYKYSRMNDWKETTKEEMLVFIGLILHMGTIRLNSIQDYWKTDTLFGLRVFADNMSRDRFLLLLRALHFEKIPEKNAKPQRDRLYKIRRMVNLFNTRMAEIYYPGRDIILNESMILWQGRLVFKQYIPSEGHKNGMKLYMLTTPDGMVAKFMVDDCGGKGHAQRVVLNLMEGLLDNGHSVFMDNYYNSYELVKYLAKRKTHCTGTIREDGKMFPNEVREKELNKGETIAKYANGVMIAKWKDKSDVTYVSNEYKNDILETTNKRGETRSKPLPITQCNKFMADIDKQDQMLLAYYPCKRNTIRWPAKIFIHILQLIIANSHFLYNEYSNENMQLYDFRLSVIRCLLKSESIPRIPVQNSAESEHVLKQREEKKGGKTLRKHCKSCYSMGKRKETIYVCHACEGSPGYCLDCAKITHT